MDNNASSHNSSHNSSLSNNLDSCFVSTPSSSIFVAFTVTNLLLLLPLAVLILALGFRRWLKGRGSVAAANPLDIFTYHMVAMEMIGICGSVACCCGTFFRHQQAIGLGCNMFAIISCVKMFFHVLTCVERYLAVVHPISYLSLSKSAGVMIRNVGIGFVWLLLSGLLTLRFVLTQNFNMILFFCNLISSLIVVSFCSLSVLRVLIRPGPGEGGGSKGNADQSKHRAFVTITAITAVLLLRFAGNLVCQSLALAAALSRSVGCAVQVSGVWFCLPSSYVLPLLFLHRSGKHPCCKGNTESG
ncbi:hypothetical protein F2P81_018100 [Scophthalmus maximus]|uniref:G-protein coupled receptors family 1 profile domain-containing protein n=1 Tax=Scophthalmus maximus TaxID=52904 RepID=A0A6A4S9H1_SCOMX|nr:hypothetical protein F2P81_018100 [Scophthalmus maximus]